VKYPASTDAYFPMTNPPEKEYIVVYADDDPDDIELVTEAFDKNALNVNLKTFSDGLTVLSYLQNSSIIDNLPCLIILDIRMPGMNGKDCLKHVRQIPHLKYVPVVLFTASVSDRDNEFAKLYNAGFITKPLSSAQMEKIAARFIEHCTDEIQKLISR
jgi:CheY-like chemotaxis protein